MGIDFWGRRALTNRATGGRKLASGHEDPRCQDVASGHPKGRSAAKEPRRGLTRGSVLTLGPTSCGSSHPLFAIYARIYTAANIGLVADASAETWRGLTVAPEHRCAPYDKKRDYPYPQSLERNIVRELGAVYGAPTPARASHPPPRPTSSTSWLRARRTIRGYAHGMRRPGRDSCATFETSRSPHLA